MALGDMEDLDIYPRQGHCCRGRGKYNILGELKRGPLAHTIMSKDYRLVTNGAGEVRAYKSGVLRKKV